jgi:hypothetical protein
MAKVADEAVCLAILSMRSPFVVRVFGFTNFNDSSLGTCMVMELCNYNLADWIAYEVVNPANGYL